MRRTDFGSAGSDLGDAATVEFERPWFPWDSESTVPLPVLSYPAQPAAGGAPADSAVARVRARLARGMPGGATGRQLALMAMIDAAGTGAFLAVSVIYLTRSVGLSVAAVGFGLAVAAVLALVTTVPVGALADRFGPRRVLVVISLWRAACYAAYPLVHSFAGFVVIVCLLALVDRTAAPITQALVGQVVEETDRVRAMALMRSLRNVGFTLGALLGSVALTVDTRSAYACVLLANAASYAGMAFIAGRMRLRVGTASTVRRTISLRVLRDRPYLTIAGLNALLTVHMPLLSIGLPLWIADHSHAPRAIVAPLIAVNTVLAVAFQVRASRGSDTTGGAARCLRLAGFALAACCLILAVVPGLPRTEAVVVLVLAIVALTAGELFQSAGGWGLSYELAVEHQQGAYLSVFWLGVSAQQIAAPLFLGLILSTGPIGWVVLAVLLAAAGLAVPTVTRWAVAARARSAAAF